jgi:phosphatidylserine/phosphatidylglycerophosphate/cardiolipin synthase-like enzyme
MGGVRASATANGVLAKAYAGATGVLVAFDVEAGRRPGLLGFALERREGATGPQKWLKGSLQFRGVAHVEGERTPTNAAPVQKFRWSDYGVHPGRSYRYTVHPVYGSPAALVVEDGPTVAVRTESFRQGRHAVLFNRAAAASQAFSRDFPEVEAALAAAKEAGEPRPPLPPHVLAWLARGMDAEIFHHKFALLSRLRDGRRSPVAVLCGSTNFTHNGVFRQANALHLARDPAVARRYLDLFDLLFGGADVGATRAFVTGTNPVDLAASGPTFVGFSPRRGRTDLDAFVDVVRAARRDVLFCTAFALYDPLEDALLGAPNDAVLRFGLQNSSTRVTGTHKDRTARFVATALLPSGLDGFLKESLAGQDGRILVHTKLVVCDFTSDRPTVISGSHNLSVAASEGNDENVLVLRADGDTRLADCYGVEALRLYDHYRFRFATRKGAPAPFLTADDRWADRYFRPGSLNERDRLAFAGLD